ncbi:MAG: pyridoxine 5'-phosphate synthase, partial [Candidatus Dadabacteria bacterium]|nr:pyridoxine 5'-phosphate synthase [Candidatus Dadabacteria bacterium]
KELTTEGGLDVGGNFKNVNLIVKKLKDSGIFTSIFIDPDTKQIEKSKQTAADMVEIHTGKYADSIKEEQRIKELNEIISSVKHAFQLDLRVAAGHGLDYTNTRQIAEIKEIEELNIGYNIICRAVMVGIERAVKEMKQLCTV